MPQPDHDARSAATPPYKADPLSDPTSGQGANAKPGLSDYPRLDGMTQKASNRPATEEIDLDVLPDPDGSTFWHPDFYEPFEVGYGQKANRAGDATNAPAHDTEAGTSMPDNLTAPKCPSCGSPVPALHGGACEHDFHDPHERSRPASGKLTAYLLSRGWERSDLPAATVGECGASSDTVGYCEKPARWRRQFPHRGPLCAEQRSAGAAVRRSLPAPRGAGVSDSDTRSAAQKQLAWLEEMERIEQEVFPDARPRSEVVVPCTCSPTDPIDPVDPECPIHGGAE